MYNRRAYFHGGVVLATLPTKDVQLVYMKSFYAPECTMRADVDDGKSVFSVDLAGLFDVLYGSNGG